MIAPVAAWPPVEGHYATKLARNGVRVPVRIWFGQAIIAGETQDRSPGWHCEIDGRTDEWERDRETGYRCLVAIPIDRAWPYVAREPVTEAEYRYLVEHAAWIREHQPDHPKANPRKAVDFHTIMPF